MCVGLNFPVVGGWGRGQTIYMSISTEGSGMPTMSPQTGNLV